MIVEKESELKETKVTGKITDTNYKQYLTFKLGEELFGLELAMTKEIIKVRKITNVPNTEADALGVINLRGQIVPVLDLTSKFGLESNDVKEEEQRIIIVHRKDILISFLVDSVKEVVDIDPRELKEVYTSKDTIKNDYFKGVTKVDKELLMIINLNKVIFESEEE